MKGSSGSRGIAPSILGLDTKWRSVVSFTTWPLYPQGNSPSCPLDRRLGESQSRSWRGGEEKNSQPLPGLELPIIQPVAQYYTAELSRFLINWISNLIVSVRFILGRTADENRRFLWFLYKHGRKTVGAGRWSVSGSLNTFHVVQHCPRHKLTFL
jgi:hypothetical protein